MPKKLFIWLFISTARKYRISLDLGGHIPSHFGILLCKEKEKNNYYSLNWGCRDHMVVKSTKQRLGDLLFLLRFLLLLLLLHHPDWVMYCYSTFLFHYYSYYYSSTHFCPLYFSEMPWSNFMKPCRNIICHVKLCVKGLIFSKWLPWKRPKC